LGLSRLELAALLQRRVVTRYGVPDYRFFRVSGAGVVKLGDQEFDALSFAART
jgi:hypothetical protein